MTASSPRLLLQVSRDFRLQQDLHLAREPGSTRRKIAHDRRGTRSPEAMMNLGIRSTSKSWKRHQLRGIMRALCFRRCNWQACPRGAKLRFLRCWRSTLCSPPTLVSRSGVLGLKVHAVRRQKVTAAFLSLVPRLLGRCRARHELLPEVCDIPEIFAGQWGVEAGVRIGKRGCSACL